VKIQGSPPAAQFYDNLSIDAGAQRIPKIFNFQSSFQKNISFPLVATNRFDNHGLDGQALNFHFFFSRLVFFPT